MTLEHVDLRQQTYDLLPLVRKPSDEERRALEERGLVFLPIQAQSYAQVVANDVKYFLRGELQYANSRGQLRHFIPPVMEIALNPGIKRLVLSHSFNEPRSIQLQMIEQYSQDEIEGEFPGAKAIMLPVTAYAQADRAYRQITGGILFMTYFASGLDNISGADETLGIRAGRRAPALPFTIRGRHAGGGIGIQGAVPAVVFLRK